MVLDTILTAGLGLSFGFQLAPVIVPVQNALPLEDTGIGMGTVMFFLDRRRLRGGVVERGAYGGIERGGARRAGPRDARRRSGLALMHTEVSGYVGPDLRAGLAGAVRTAFSDVFFAAAVISALTFLGSFRLKEIPLRSR